MDYKLLLQIGAAAFVLVIALFLAYYLTEQKRLKKYLNNVRYHTADARNATMLHFPLPVVTFRISDTDIIWGNDSFLRLAGETGSRMDAKVSDVFPEFSGKWLLEGKNQYPGLLQLEDRKYRVYGNTVHRTENGSEDSSDAYMGLAYFVDVTEGEELRLSYEQSRMIAGIIVIDNLDELYKNQPDHIRNSLIVAIGDKLSEWALSYHGILRKYDRDRYFCAFEQKDFDAMRSSKFPLIEEIHVIENPSGVNTTISIGFGENAPTFSEALQYADMANELALTRGGDQVVVKNRINFEFYGGRGGEVEKRTKVRSRVMANTLAELIKDSSRVFVMGHKYSDLDSIGAAVGIVCLSRKMGTNAQIVCDETTTVASSLVTRMKAEKEYKNVFVTPQEAIYRADGGTLLVVVDTNRPEHTDSDELLETCRKVAVVDHHRVAASYIQNAALWFIEPYASSAAELVTEILQENLEKNDIMKCEAEALLSGISLDTKNFTIRTGERTFDAAAFLRSVGADTTEVKKFQQADMDETIAKYRILQDAKLYRNIAIAVPQEPQARTVAAMAADELLNISGVEASLVVFPDESGTICISARSIGELNVQIVMEKLGGGGNRSVAAAQFKGETLESVTERLYSAIDEYLGPEKP